MIDLPPQDADTSRGIFAHHTHGLPSRVHEHRDITGRLLFVSATYPVDESRGRLEPLTLSWTWRGDTWSCQPPDGLRPLYGLDTLRAVASARVLVVEGERNAEAARVAFPRNPVVSWTNGELKPADHDWGPLAGRLVCVWPTNNVSGHTACTDIARKLAAMNCQVMTIQTAGKPDNWDVAAAVIDEGMDPNEVRDWAVKKRIDWMVAPQPEADAPEPPRPPESLQEARKRRKGAEAAPEAPEPAGRVTASQPERWDRLGLARKSTGAPYASVDNALRVLTDYLPTGALHYDPFLNQVRYVRKGVVAKLADEHVLEFLLHQQRTLGLQDMKKFTVCDAVAIYARRHQVNSLQLWLKNLSWDGEARVEQLLLTGFGSVDSPYHRAVSRCFLLGMVARAMRPGCQVDTLPILEGPQGAGKSRGLEALAGEFYADIDSSIGSKEFCEQIQGKWLVELSELSAMRASEVERVKTGITRRVDVYREPFAVLASDHPRQCVFAGTTNAHQYLMDDTGNRRFWPVTCGEISRAWIEYHREQLFAEALVLLNAGATWWEVPALDAEQATKLRMFVDAIEDSVTEYLLAHSGDVRVFDMLQAWEIPRGQWTAQLQRRITSALRSAGYHLVKTQNRRVWRAPEYSSLNQLRVVRRLKSADPGHGLPEAGKAP